MAELTASIHVEGLDSLDAALRDLPEIVQKEVIASALDAAGGIVLRAARENIHSRTGRTAADLRLEVQLEDDGGAAAVGGTVRGKTGRAHVLRWLELGTRPTRKNNGRIVAGASDRTEARRAARALRRIGDVGAFQALQARIQSGRIGARRALTLPGGLLRRSVKHRGIAPQSPLTRALADHGDEVIALFRDHLWAGIKNAAARLHRPAA